MAGEPSIPVASRRTQIFEFLVVGGITPFLYPLSWAFRRVLGFDAAELGVSWFFFYLAYFVNDPHFGVTYLLFYRDVKRRALGPIWGSVQRARYWFAGFIAPLLMAAWCTMTLFHRAAPGIGMLIQLLFLLVGWHY